MAEGLRCDRELVVEKSADEVWEWLSKLNNVMTTNQFHMRLDCDEAEIRNPRTGLDIPIVHNILGRQAIRIARIIKFEDYAISWGERLPPDAGYVDSFPHSEGWRVESTGAHQCRIHNHLRGAFMLPVGKLIGKHVWDTIMPSILDNDLQDVALATGAVEHRVPVAAPPGAAAMLRLMHARQIDGQPVEQVLDMSLELLKPPH
jgi:hypothetical protein